MLANYRSKILTIKSDFEKQFNADLEAYKKAIIREIIYLKQKYNIQDMDELASIVLKHFKFPAQEQIRMNILVKDTMRQIGEVWDNYFAGAQNVVPLQDGDYEKILAAYGIKWDFDQINKKHRRILMEEMQRAARADYGFETLRRRLIKRSVPDAATLANTSVAMFDNAYMFENAQAAGITAYKYDGVLHPNSRPFCKKHLGNVYTEKQIALLNNGQGLSVKTSCGGFNCTHWWTPVVGEDKSQIKNIKIQSGKQNAVNFIKVNPDKFYISISKGLPSDLQKMISFYNEEELANLGVSFYLSDNEKSGYGLTRDKDLINVFSATGAHQGPATVIDAIKNGAETLDCFDTNLPGFYRKFGFDEYKRVKWDDRYAPEGWNYERFGRPDIIFMRLRKDK